MSKNTTSASWTTTTTFPFTSRSGVPVNLQVVRSQFDVDSVTAPSSEVNTVIIVCHGRERNASEIYDQTFAAVQGRRRTILVVAPHFLNGLDKQCIPSPSERALIWKGNEWGEGGEARKPEECHVSSFEALDAMVEFYAQLAAVQRILLVGHSLGAQLVQRYSILGRSISSKLEYVVMNPSTYMHLNEAWPYKYGLADRQASSLPSTYLSAFDHRQALQARMLTRRVHFLQGARDTGVGDDRPEAMRQGTNRMDRFNAWQTHLRHAIGLPLSFSFSIVPKVGHDAGGMMCSEAFARIVHDR